MSQREQALLSEITERVNRVATIWEAAGDEALDAKTKQDVITLNKEIEEREHEVKEIRDQRDLRMDAERRQKAQREAVNRLPTPRDTGGDRDAKGGELTGQSLGARFVQNADFEAWRKTVVRGDGVTKAQFGRSPAVAVKTLITGVSGTSAGALVFPEQLAIQDMGTYMRPLTIRQLISTGRTGSDAVEYPLMGAVTNNAAIVAEATATSGSSGQKPESALAMSAASTTVKTIAHWIPVTRRALADAPQIETMINSFLLYGLDEELEDQIFSGDGTGENFTGILNTPGTQSQAYETDLLTTLRKARTKVRVVGRSTPSAYVLHPYDWEKLDLLQDNEGRYYYGGPSVLGQPRLWGLPVVESEGMPEGTGMCAEWRWAMLWDREDASILVSDSHSDFFTRNLIAILAELRAAFAIIRPAAFVEADLTP